MIENTDDRFISPCFSVWVRKETALGCYRAQKFLVIHGRSTRETLFNLNR